MGDAGQAYWVVTTGVLHSVRFGANSKLYSIKHQTGRYPGIQLGLNNWLLETWQTRHSDDASTLV